MNTTTNTNTKPATRPAGFTKADWETKTLRIFDGLVKLTQRKVTVSQFVNHPIVKELMEKCCGAKTPEDRYPLFVSLLIYSCNYGTVNHTPVLKVKCIASVRKWFNGGYRELMARPVVYKQPKQPTEKKATQKKSTKKVTNKSIEQWVNGASEDDFDLLKIAIAMREMGAAA